MARHHWRQPNTETGAIDLLLGEDERKRKKKKKEQKEQKRRSNTTSRLG